MTNMGASAEGAEMILIVQSVRLIIDIRRPLIYVHLLGTTLKMGRSLLVGGEDTGGLNDVLGASLAPGDVGGVALLVHLDGLAVDDKVTGLVDGDVTLEIAVGRVVLQHVDLCVAL